MKIQSFLLIISIILLFTSCKKEKTEIYNLRCENLSNPMGINTTIPRFSWKIKSDRNGTEQKAFQILIASDRSLLEKNQADLWDSGKTESPERVLISYKGKPLKSGDMACWKVRIWDETGAVSPWSPVAGFSIGLLNKADWQASYIGFPTENKFSECPQLYKSFDIENTNARTFLHVNSLGYHEVYLNGQKAGDGVLTPAVSQFDKRSLAITYDVTQLLKKGRNDLILWLGSGWYSEGHPGVVNEGPLVKAQLEQITGKERKIILVTDSSWKGRSSGYLRIDKWRAHHFGGEEINGALVKNDLSAEKLDQGEWAPVSVVSVPEHQVSPQMAELNRIQDTIKPIKIQRLAKDTFLVDMGKCLTGWVEIHFPPLQKGQLITIEYSDHIDQKGQFAYLKQIDRYIASGKGNEFFKNKFNYHGFRYIRISNLATAPVAESIKAYLIHTDYNLASSFACSDADLNQIHDMIFYTLRCLSIGGDLVDCPQIERLGYGGDGNASTQTAQTMFDMGPLYANWLQAWADCVQDDGGMPHTAPNPYAAGGGPYWCGFIITASWNTYMNYGDLSNLQKYYPVMQRWLEYVDKYSVDGLLKKWPDTDYRGWYLGDWAVPDGVDQKAEASVDVVNNCFVAVCYDKMKKIAQVLGKTVDAEMYRQKKIQLQEKIHQTFFNKEQNSYATGSQIDLTYPMLAGVVPDSLYSEVKKSLYSEIEDKHGGHWACGLVGIPVFTEWAIQNRADELMYSLLKKRDYPSYLYMTDNGATTTWEHWNGERSRIHNCYNGIGSWFYQAVGGIRNTDGMPAYKKVIIDPQIPKGITWAKTSKETPYGTLSVNWETEEKTMKMELEIPVGTEAEVVIPENTEKYTIGNTEHLVSEGNPSFILKSGKYRMMFFAR